MTEFPRHISKSFKVHLTKKRKECFFVENNTGKENEKMKSFFIYKRKPISQTH